MKQHQRSCQMTQTGIEQTAWRWAHLSSIKASAENEASDHQRWQRLDEWGAPQTIPASHSVNQSVGKDLSPAIRMGNVRSSFDWRNHYWLAMPCFVCYSQTMFMSAREVSLHSDLLARVLSPSNLFGFRSAITSWAHAEDSIRAHWKGSMIKNSRPVCFLSRWL